MADQLRAVLSLPGAFLSWWLGELAGLLPRGLRSSRARPSPCLVLAFRSDGISLIRQARRGGEEVLGHIADDDEDQLALETGARADALSALAERSYRKWPLIVQLAQHLGMRKLVDLPLAAKDDLGQVLQFELDRLTPFKPDDVCFAWQIVKADHKAGRMRVLLEIAPRVMIDRAADLAGRFGRQIDRIELEALHGDEAPLDLRPQDVKAKPSSGWLKRTLRLITFVLLVIAVVLPMRQQQAVIAELDADVAAARAEAEESLALREQLAFLSSETTFLTDARNSRPTMTALLAELTSILPDHSHLLQLRIAEESVELMGLADKASDLIAILSQSPILAAPKFSSPVTRDARSSKERFHISVDLAEKTS